MILDITQPDGKGDFHSEQIPATINVDSLTINCTSKKLDYYLTLPSKLKETGERKIVDNHIQIGLDKTTCNYIHKHFLDVFFDGDKFLTIALEPKNKIFVRNQLQIIVRNHRLYQQNWTDILDCILQVLDIQFHSFSLLHIALDGSQLMDKLLNLYYTDNLTFTSGKIEFKGKLEKKRLSAKRGFQLNEKDSDFYVTFYRKNNDYEAKQYIKLFHETNGVHGDKVDRIEIRISGSKIFKKYEGSYYDLDREDKLLAIFKEEFNKRVVFNDMNNYSFNSSRNKKYRKILFAHFPKPRFRYLTLTQKPQKEVCSVNQKKTTIKQLHMRAVVNPKDYNLLALEELIHSCNLLGWYNRKYMHWDGYQKTKSDHVADFVNKAAYNEQKQQKPSKVDIPWATVLKQVLAKIVIVDLKPLSKMAKFNEQIPQTSIHHIAM